MKSYETCKRYIIHIICSHSVVLGSGAFDSIDFLITKFTYLSHTSGQVSGLGTGKLELNPCL